MTTTAIVTRHWRRIGKRLTACGRKTKFTAAETRVAAKVTCKTCLKAMKAWGQR